MERATQATEPNRGTALVAMSGGVDSSVAAALLQRAGFTVKGVTLQLSAVPGTEEACQSAAAAAERLGIDHLVLDGRAPFDERVLRPSWDEYAAGRTPNPCIACNERVKLELVAAEARRQGAQVIATGHYARIEHSDDRPPRLLRGRDRGKDQSYFLCRLTREQLELTRLPLGELTKDEVRQLARELGLPQAERPESQDACIAGRDNLAETLRQRFGAESLPGTIVDAAGRRLGEHAGIHHYTIGQRRGIGVALGRRAYVAAIDAASARVTLTTDGESLRCEALRAVDVRWHAEVPIGQAVRAAVQVRYRSRAVPALVERLGEREALVRFDGDRPQAVAPGQAVVFYGGRDDQLVLGGGWIRVDDA